MTKTNKDPLTEMTTEMVNTWTETGTKMWKSWFDLMNVVPAKNSLNNGQEEMEEAVQRFADNRELMVRFLQLSVNAWQDILPKVESGDNWLDIVNKYTEQMRSQLSVFSGQYSTLTQDTSKLWQLYMDEMQKFSQMWLDPFGFSMQNMTKAFTGDSNAFIELNHLYWKLLYEDILGGFMQSPSLGPTRELNSKLVGGFEAWRNLYKATVDYQIVLGDLQVRSFEALMKKLVDLAEKGEKIKDWKQFQTLWSEVADDIFEKAFLQEKNLKIRG
ncbi:MAG TPA: poly(R)-hydroxyalkanoic acid synthase subunit PhaE, partial [Allocoleopsis sp.]